MTAREAVEKEVKSAQDKIEQAKKQLQDKDAKYMQLYEENMNLQEALIRETKSA